MVDKLPQGESLKQDNNLESIKKQTQDVICRIFFVRHGETDKIGGLQGVEESLNAIGSEQIEKIGKSLQILGCKEENTLILYAGGTKRIRESKDILQKYNIGTFKENAFLETTEREISPDGEIRQKESRMEYTTKQMGNIINLVKSQILDTLVSPDKENNYKNIILLGHKASKIFPEIIKESGEDIILSSNRIQPGETMEIDINNKHKFNNYGKHKEVLNLTAKNYGKILEILRQEEEMNDIIKLFVNKEIQLYELQNIINQYFQEYPALYEKYLASENEDLMVFCLANLIRLKRYKNIPIFLEKDLKSVSISEKKNIFDSIKKENNILEKFLQIFFEDKQDSNEYTNLKGYMVEELLKIGDDEVLLMNYYENIYPLVKDIREKSLDMRIVNGEDIHPKFNLDKCMIEKLLIPDGVLAIYHYGDIYPEFILDDHISNIGSNISSKLDKKILYIEANSGTGKSFLLSQINEKIKNNKFMENKRKIFPIFISLSGEASIKSLKDKITSIQDNYKKITGKINPIIMLDSLDESNFNEEERKELLTYLSNKSELASDVIITSRKGYIPKDTSDSDRGNILKKIGIVQLKEMDDMNVDKYVKEYFENKEDVSRKIEEFNTLKNNQRLHGIEKNPLILSMICYLIETGNDIKHIRSIGALYGQIVDLRLRYRESKKNKQGRKILVDQEDSEEGKEVDVQRIINKRKEFLCALAYQEGFEGKRIDETNFSILKEKYPGIILDKDCLNLLFRKNDNNKEFEFIHQSFKDYFLLKGFENDCNEEGKIKKDCEKKYNGKILHKLGIKAIYLGYISILELLIKNGYYVDYKNPRNLISNFMLACQFGSKEVVERFFDKIDFDSIMDQDIYGKYVFTFACRNGDKEVSELFYRNIQEIKKKISKIKENEKEHIKDFYDKQIEDSINNAFMDACSNGRIDIIEGLADKGADIHIKDKEGRNGFMLACQYGYIETAKRLTDKGADIHIFNILGDNTFMRACEFGHIEIVKRLADEKGIDIHTKTYFGYNAFMRACEFGHIEIVKRLIDKNANIHTKNKEGKNAFMYACEFGYIEIAKLLIDKNADINVKDKEGKNAFMYACEFGHMEIIKLLIDKNADINIKDKEGKNAFMYACENGFIEIAKRLSDKGVDISIKDKEGRTGFMIACKFGHIEIIKRLIDKGADIHAKDKYLNNAFVLACENGHMETAKRLADDKGVEIHIFNMLGDNAFMLACRNGYMETAKRLADDKGADIHAKTDFGENAFMYACEFGHIGIAQRLADDKGADIHAKDYNLNNNIMLACQYGRIEIVKRLIDKITTTISDLEKSLLIAKEKGHEEIVKIIQAKINEIEK